MKHKKFSAAILCGYEKVDGRQWFGGYCRSTDNPRTPRAVCVLGAGALCNTGNALAGGDEECAFLNEFQLAWGIYPDVLNDGDDAMDPMPWEHIYGMARAAGL